MRATGQTVSLEGSLTESERRIIAARAILGEWLSGSGGGWQDSGGIWPGIKLIQGVSSAEGDIEYGISRGCLLPCHKILTHEDVSLQTRKQLQESLILVHGGMAQDVGPILEMVTERYLLRSKIEWQGRLEALTLFDQIVTQLKKVISKRLEDRRIRISSARSKLLFHGRRISTLNRLLIESRRIRERFLGILDARRNVRRWNGFSFHPSRKIEAQNRLQEIMSSEKRRFEQGIPFAMEPVVYDLP